MDLMQNLSIEPGYFLIQGCVDIDKSCIRLAEYKSTPDFKKILNVLCAQKKGYIDKNAEKEAELYSAGGF